jgi:hypothetical protein
MFIVSVYDLRTASAQEVAHWAHNDFSTAINDYFAFAESFNPEHYGVLLYTGKGDIIFGFEEEL